MRRESRPSEVTSSRSGQVEAESRSTPTVVSFQYSSHAGSCSGGSIVPSAAVVGTISTALVHPSSWRGDMPGHDGVMAGGKHCIKHLNVMGIQSVESLSEWVPGRPFLWACARTTHEQINARVISLGSAYVRVVLQACEYSALQEQEPARVVAPATPPVPESRWDVLDQVNFEEVCRTRFPVFQSCPFQLRGRFRQASRVAQWSGWSRCPHGEIVHSVAFHVAQETPCRAKVGKDELCRRFDKFIAGEGADLIREGHQACALEGHATHHGLDSSERSWQLQQIKLGGDFPSEAVLDKGAIGSRDRRNFPGSPGTKTTGCCEGALRGSPSIRASVSAAVTKICGFCGRCRHHGVVVRGHHESGREL